MTVPWLARALALSAAALVATALPQARAQSEGDETAAASANPDNGFEMARNQCLVRLGKGRPTGTGLPSSPRLTTTPLSALEKGTLTELEGDYKRYEDAWHEHNLRILTILSREYQTRKTHLDKRYQKRLTAAEDEERRRQLEALALLQQFIETYPDHPQHTPDAMFRLADLYVDEAEFEFDQRQAAIAAGEFAIPDPGDEDEGDAPIDIADYSKAIALWTEIATRFTSYRQRPDVLYLMAYYLKQTGEERRALQVARGLVCGNRHNPMDPPPAAPTREAVRAILGSSGRSELSNPYQECKPITDNQRLVEEAWVRIVGDSHFYTPGELADAISAYQQVTSNKDSKYYDEALYKLAWSYYRNDDFRESIAAFDESIILSDKIVATGGEPLELRPEAVQYIAVAFTDPWELDSQVDPDLAWQRIMEFYGGRLQEPHIRDVFATLGEAFKLIQAYPQAIDAWKIALAHTPLHPKNPILHQSVVTTYELMGDKDAADEEAARLASRYADCTEWYLANEMNPDAMRDQKKIGERMLRAAAENTHRAAQIARNDYTEMPSPEKKAYYVELYGRAAKLYLQFLETYPGSDDVYEFTYRLGETSFFSGDYLGAIRFYAWIRDHREMSTTRFEQATKSIIQSYEGEIDRRVAAGSLSKPPVPTLDELKSLATPIRSMAMPELFSKLRKAYDEYHTLVNDPASAPNMGLLAALVSYRYRDLSDAEKRFQRVVDKFCGTPEALVAKDAVLAIYEVRGESEKFRATNESFIASRCGTDEDVALAKAQNQAREFRDAEDLFNRQQYDAAADAFYKYYKSAKADDPSLPIALYNSAIAYQRSGRPKTAVHLFREFTSNPRDDFRKSQYYVEALFLTAKAQQQGFDNEGAVQTYLQTARSARKGGKQPPGERTLEQIQLDSLYNAALLREIDRVYHDPRGGSGTGAVSLYQRYARLEQDRRKRDRAFWQMAQIWRNAGNTSYAAKAFEDWRKRFGRDPGNENDYVLSYYIMAKLHARKGSKTAAGRMRKATIQAWEQIGRPQKSAAADMAAEFAFLDAERFYARRFEPWKIRKAPRTEKKAKAVLAELNRLSDRAKAGYDEIGQYSSSFWSQAALVRVGDIRFFQALKLQQAPVPKEIVRLDERAPEKEVLLRYEEAIEARVKPLTDAAKQQWERVANAAKAAGVSNKWTKLAQERLHDFVSQDQYPVLRDELVEGTQTP